MSNPNEVTAMNSHAVMAAEIVELRRQCWTLIAASKQALPSMPDLQQRELLEALIRAEKYLST